MTQNATDFENQVVNLVKAAMSGDEEANDVIVQIIEAAKKGDEQALKVVALIKQLTQSTSDQAEEGAEEENTEAMKCGGKVRAKMKAKKSTEKKEEGGEIPEEKCGGTAKKMRKVACKTKKCEEGDKLTDTQKFLLGAKCGCKVKKTKKCEKGDTLDNWEDPLSVKCGGKAKKVKKGENGVQLPKGAHGQTWSRSTSSTTVFSKGGKQCPCALKRIGGKIVTVDTCTGLPVHKQGGSIKKYQDPAEPIVHKRFFGLDYKYDPNTRKLYIGESGPDVWEEASWDKIANMRGSQEFINKLYDSKYFNPIEGLYLDKDEAKGKVVYSETGRFPFINSVGWNTSSVKTDYVDGKYVINPGTDNEETLDFSEFYDKYPDWRVWSINYNRAGYRGEEIPYKDGKAQWDPAQQKYVYKIYRTVSAPATQAGESTEGSASAASQYATAATAGSSTTAQQGATAAATSTSTGASSQSGSRQNFASWLKQNAPQYQSYQERKKLAEKYGIQDYKGSLQQNLQMWDRMKNDSNLNSQASSEADVIREATRVASLPVPIIPASKKVEFPTISSADIRSNSVSTPLTLKTEPIKLPTIRLANRKTPQSTSLPNEGTEYETPQRTYQQRLPQVEY